MTQSSARCSSSLFAIALLLIASLAHSTESAAAERPLEVHRVFGSHMVLQRDHPIKVWGWATTGAKVKVQLGQEAATVEAKGDKGRWEAVFKPREASGAGVKLVITSGEQTVTMENVVFGDVWVMNGQSNMAWGLQRTLWADMEMAQAHLPLLRGMGITPNEASTLQTQIREEALEPWAVSTPETAGGFSAIGFAFGSRLQRALQIPIGIIDTSRGGASIESLVPAHKFDDHPITKRYKAYTLQRIAEFDLQAKIDMKWQREIDKLKRKKVPEDKWPKKSIALLRSWDIPGKSPSDMASCYNGMFGVFKGISIKGVLFHQGFNNALSGNCRPKRYRALMHMMVEGWRDDFNNPKLPVGIIGFCAGSNPQTADNFEAMSFAGGAYIREAQRLGLADVGDPENTVYLSADDVQVPGLHPFKKRDHGERAARWALNRVYEKEIHFDTAKLVSAEPKGDVMVLTFDKPVYGHDHSMQVEGFSIADKSGKFYKAYAAHLIKPKKKISSRSTPKRDCEPTVIHVWSPLVKEPVAVRYAWAVSPMGNLYVDGKSWLPLPNFRTDAWDWPESDDPAELAMERSESRARYTEAEERNTFRRAEEAKVAAMILQRRLTLGQPLSK